MGVKHYLRMCSLRPLHKSELLGDHAHLVLAPPPRSLLILALLDKGVIELVNRPLYLHNLGRILWGPRQELHLMTKQTNLILGILLERLELRQTDFDTR
jgi:hypothetical protein